MYLWFFRGCDLFEVLIVVVDKELVREFKMKYRYNLFLVILVLRKIFNW